LIKPGMFARATMVTDHLRNVTTVPREAVQQAPSGVTITVVDAENVARRRPVTLGASDADSIAITQGVQPGERVVIMSATPIKDGQPVRIGGNRQGRRSESKP
jgi:membrane fusion protein (multidrug efflux system)